MKTKNQNILLTAGLLLATTLLGVGLMGPFDV